MTHFPDFDNDALFEEVLDLLEPFGFVDTTWGNDECPSIGFLDEDGDDLIRVWVDYADPGKRAYEGAMELEVTHRVDNMQYLCTSPEHVLSVVDHILEMETLNV